MAFQVEFLPSARRKLRRLPKPAQLRIVARIGELADDPRPADSLKLAGAEYTWRIRVGDYRVLYEVRGKRLLVLVIRIGYRKDVYRKRK